MLIWRLLRRERAQHGKRMKKRELALALALATAMAAATAFSADIFVYFPISLYAKCRCKASAYAVPRSTLLYPLSPSRLNVLLCLVSNQLPSHAKRQK